MSSSVGPVKTIRQTSLDNSNSSGINSRNSSWVVAFVSYAQPAAFMTSAPENMQPLLAVKSDYKNGIRRGGLDFRAGTSSAPQWP